MSIVSSLLILLLSLTYFVSATVDGWDYSKGSSQKIRGVNLGGWLVLEKWMSPTLFSNNAPGAACEWTFSEQASDAQAALEQHWATWIVEDDFRQMAEAGLNHVRLPIGYWAVGNYGSEPYKQGSMDYVKKAIQWSKNNGLKVMISMHGLPGSQNGQDHSGHSGATQWQTATNIARSYSSLAKVVDILSAAEYEGTVTSIGIANEPNGWNGAVLDALKVFYPAAYEQVRASTKGEQIPDKRAVAPALKAHARRSTSFVNPHHRRLRRASQAGCPAVSASPNATVPEVSATGTIAPANATTSASASASAPAPSQTSVETWTQGQRRKSDIAVVFHDGWQGAQYWDQTLSGEMHTDVMLDYHSYFAFGNEQSWNRQDYINNVCDIANKVAGAKHSIVFGEWATTNKLGTENSGDWYKNQDYVAWVTKFWEAQAQIYESAGNGWIYWSWKVEYDISSWSYKSGLKLGIIPKDAKSYKNSNICGK